ncbi:GDSL-like Lipase/Acylhydrolase superfamily protein [Heracleum sosnowskyi]|uniref:GDSL-like Lipase/Acylhydrolase superfamily protein n=1 Tax=Heracleum sosnowskyi TaxID=360622 RepID=A0AAD8HSE9_9APIA|nr:GDSL-like Lipase/Acylhydrolase superfamily protein [Heracleum sosnowskyi]
MCSKSFNNILGEVENLNEQIKYFEEVTLPELEKQGKNSSRESVSKYLFVVGSGGKNHTSNYFLNRSRSNISSHAFTDNLITTLSSQVKKLYNLGAKNFVIMSLYPLGCNPRSLAAQPQKKGCNKSLNDAAMDFNYYLKSLVKRLKPEMPGSNFVIVNAYKIIEDIIKNPTSRGFTDTTQPCCEPSKEEKGNWILCKKGGSTCEDRNKHVYFDDLHSTEAVNVALATAGYSSEFASEVYPFNIWELAQI